MDYARYRRRLPLLVLFSRNRHVPIILLVSVLGGLIAESFGSFAVERRQYVLGFLLLGNVVAFGAAVTRSAPTAFGLGFFSVIYHVIGWTVPDPGLLLAGLTVVMIAVLAVTIFVSGRSTGPSVLRQYGAWLGVLPWLPSLLNALLANRLEIALGRALQASLAGAILLFAFRCPARRLAWGLIAGIHLALFPVLTCGIVDDVAPEATSFYTSALSVGQFGGGSCAYLHPNLLGLAGITLTIAWFALAGPAVLVRAAGWAVSLSLVALSGSRTAMGAALIGIAVAAATLWQRRVTHGLRGLFVLGFLVLALGGTWFVARGFFVQERIPGAGVLTGRGEIWSVGTQGFLGAPLREKLLGTSEGGVDASVTLQVGNREVSFAPHNAALGYLRRAGVIGLVMGLVGAGIAILRLRTIQKSAHAGAVGGLIVAALATSPVESWLFGGSLWIWIVVSERLATDPAT